MRILILTASLPYPLASGGAIRTYGILKGLHEAGHDITLLSFSEIDACDTPLAAICQYIEVIPPPNRSKIDRLKTLFLSNQADIETRFYSDIFKEKLIHLIQQNDYDLIQFEAIEIACYLPIVKQLATNAKLCFDTFNAEADLQRVIFEIDKQDMKRLPIAAYSYIQSRRIAKYEGDLCRMADLVIAVSQEDHMLLSQYRNDDRTTIVPSGIFVADYAASDETVEVGENAIVFTGKMDYRPNVDAMLWFADSILPKIPDAHLTIVGQKPHPRIQHLPEHDNITLTGWVDSVQPYLDAATVYIAPLRMGSGTRLKILEAMASGCAIVATSIAAAGLSDDMKSALVIADDEISFAKTVSDLLKNPAKCAEMGACAKQMVRASYDWSVLIPRLLNAYQEVGIG
ncbi:MAG: glycosyltransferase [Anaerolineae bacterium]|nr:glycosyltransferase [Anaerolineae bacterium]MDQ7036962.1 glycosyltransferase [Anaerolineae bacterium]